MSNYLKDLENSRLLFKTFCNGLMYGMFFYHGETLHRVTSIEGLDNTVNGVYPIKECKPCLRPMSSMTEDEKQEYLNLIVDTGGKRGLGYCLAVTRKRENVEPHLEDSKYLTPPSYHECQDWLNAKHFDYRGLIPIGLALEAPEGMYNT